MTFAQRWHSCASASGGTGCKRRHSICGFSKPPSVSRGTRAGNARRRPRVVARFSRWGRACIPSLHLPSPGRAPPRSPIPYGAGCQEARPGNGITSISETLRWLRAPAFITHSSFRPLRPDLLPIRRPGQVIAVPVVGSAVSRALPIRDFSIPNALCLNSKRLWVSPVLRECVPRPPVLLPGALLHCW